MGLWDDISGWFGGRDIDYSYGEPDIEAERFDPTPPGYEWFPRVPTAGYEDQTTMDGKEFFGSLWGALKEGAQIVIESPLLPAILQKDPKALIARQPKKQAAKVRQDGQLYTTYPRADTGTTPISVGVLPGGISPMILIAAAGAAYLLLVKKGRK